jgi:predicted helicase
MIGLYLLTTSVLNQLNVIKFGMSMRIECRWIDYLIIFADSKYEFYYEFLDNLNRNQILNIENEIIQIYQDKRSNLFQTEYFNCDKNEFNDTIQMVLNKKNINYKTHSIHDFDKKNYDNKPEPFINQTNTLIPYDYQQKVLDNIEEFYKNNNIGKIIYACGLGKALLGILIIQKLDFKSVVIGVPSLYLQKQMKNEIIKIFNYPKNILYIGSSEDEEIISTTYKNKINKFINRKSSKCKFIITTYTSCYLLSDEYIFDFKIGDEAHHLVGNDNEKTKDSFHKIKSNKTLFMTATEKIIENNRNNKIIYSMDNEKIFGKYIDTKSVCWAIENKKITDYNLIILKNTEEEIDNIIKNITFDNDEIKSSIIKNKELFLSAFMTLKSIEKYNDLTHLLIYTNESKNADLVKKYIDIILKLNIINIDSTNFYNKSLHSNSNESLNDTEEEGEITKFKKSKYGIISCVYIFGEGFDCPKLNGVVFGENMESDIRIVQSTLRPNRLDKDFPNKKAYVIIPYIDTDDFMNDNKSFDKCRKIIAKIRNVDENIEYKIKLGIFKPTIYPFNPSSSPSIPNKYNDIIDNPDELTKIILRLRYSKALSSILTEEQDEFNYRRQLNKELNILDKEQYLKQETKEYIEKYIEYIKDPEEYFKLKGIEFIWYDFMGVDTTNFIHPKCEWIKFCKEKKVDSNDSYKNLCLEYNILPRNPEYLYIGFTNILNELGLVKKGRGR